MKTETGKESSHHRTKTEITGIGAGAETSNRIGTETIETTDKVRDKRTMTIGIIIETTGVKIGTGQAAETVDLEEEETSVEMGETDGIGVSAETADETGTIHQGETIGKTIGATIEEITGKTIGETIGETDPALRTLQTVETGSTTAETGDSPEVLAETETEIGGDHSQVKEVECSQGSTAAPHMTHVTQSTA